MICRVDSICTDFSYNNLSRSSAWTKICFPVQNSLAPAGIRLVVFSIEVGHWWSGTFGIIITPGRGDRLIKGRIEMGVSLGCTAHRLPTVHPESLICLNILSIFWNYTQLRLDGFV
jgi:hypothetical protein